MTNCNKCGYAIKQSTLTFQGDKYHPECFVCHQCREQLSGKSIRQHNGFNYDQDCYAVHHAARCGKCGSPCAEPNVNYTTYGGKKFYLEGDNKVSHAISWRDDYQGFVKKHYNG